MIHYDITYLGCAFSQYVLNSDEYSKYVFITVLCGLLMIQAYEKYRSTLMSLLASKIKLKLKKNNKRNLEEIIEKTIQIWT